MSEHSTDILARSSTGIISAAGLFIFQEYSGEREEKGIDVLICMQFHVALYTDHRQS